MSIRPLAKAGFVSLIIFSLSWCSLPEIPVFDTAALTEDQVKTLNSFKCVDHKYPFYEMTYSGDYNHLKDAIHKVLGIENGASFCTTFSYMDASNNNLLARNHDYDENPVMIVFTKPAKGYASVSMVDIGLLGFSLKNIRSLNETEKTKLLFAPFLPSDGMNECGLKIGTMALPGSRNNKDRNKETLFNLEIIREVLDNAKDVDEAVAIFTKYNLMFPVVGLHYLISDKTGNSVIIEFVKGEMKIIRSNKNWQICTNAPANNAEEKLVKFREEYNNSGIVNHDINGRSYYRYLKIEEYLKNDKNILPDESMKYLKSVSMKKTGLEIFFTTIWSVVYSSDGSILLAIHRDYGKIYDYQLKMRE